MKFWLASLLCISSIDLVFAYDTEKVELSAKERPKELAGVGIEEKLSQTINPFLNFVDENEKSVTLGSYLNLGKPVILSLVYYGCGNLCNFHLNGVIEGLSKTPDKTAGKDYHFVAISIDERELPAVAREKKSNYIKSFPAEGAEDGWHFLTGKKTEIEAIAKQVGFNYKWSEDEKQWAHASAAILITPEGKISRYLHGVLFEPKTLSLATTEAGHFKISDIVNNVILFCFKYDPRKSKYTIYAYNIMKVGAALTALVVALFLANFWFKQRNSNLHRGVGA